MSLYDECFQVAVRLLAKQEYSCQKLREKLFRSRFWSEKEKNSDSVDKELVVDEVLADLQKRGYVDDERFANLWVAARLRSKPRGRRLLVQELQRQGVAGEVVERVLNEKVDFDEERETALRLLEKKRLSLERLEKAKRRQRVYQYLQSKGYDFSVIKEVWEEWGRRG